MRRRSATALRLLVVGLVLASLAVQPTPTRALAAVGRHAQALTSSAPIGETLALPSGRADGQLAIEQRERTPVPLVSLGDVAAVRVRPLPSTLTPVAPRARSHP